MSFGQINSKFKYVLHCKCFPYKSFDTKQDVLYKMKPSWTDKLSCVTVLMVKMRSVGFALLGLLQHPRSW